MYRNASQSFAIAIAAGCGTGALACNASAPPAPPGEGHAAKAATDAGATVTRTLLQQRDVDGHPEMETRVYRMEFPPGAASPPHVHTQQAAGYVLEGAFESSFDEGPPTVTRAGEAFIDVPGRVHHFRNADATQPLRFVLTGTFRKGEPIFRTPSARVQFEATAPSLSVRRPGLYPETLEYDPKHDSFVVGSFRDGRIYRVADDGEVTPFADDPRASSVLGLAVDARRDRLWAVSADLGAGIRPSALGPKRAADVAAFDLSTGALLAHFDLSALSPSPHLLNGIAVDADGTAYVTDSFSPVIYRVPFGGAPAVLVRDDRFSGPGVNLNGIVVHPDGFLLVVKKSDGALFRVPLADPRAVSQVALPRPLLGGDGVLLVDPETLVVVANQTPTAVSNAAYALSSGDGWKSAAVEGVVSLGAEYPTTAVLRGNDVFVVASHLDALISAAPGERESLRAEATIRKIATVARDAVR